MQQFKGLQRPLRVFSDTQRCRSEIAGTDEVGSNAVSTATFNRVEP